MLHKFAGRRGFASVSSLSGNSFEVRNKLFINGQWKDARSGSTFDVLNPATGELITKVASGGAEDVDEAV